MTGHEQTRPAVLASLPPAMQTAELAAQHSEESFRLLVESIQDYAIFMLDVDGNVASWNKGAEKIKGYKAEEIIGQPISRFYPKDAIDRRGRSRNGAGQVQGRFEDEGWRSEGWHKFWANVVITALTIPTAVCAASPRSPGHERTQTHRGARRQRAQDERVPRDAGARAEKSVGAHP
jgi:PAS domain S-box-containing protein